MDLCEHAEWVGMLAEKPTHPAPLSSLQLIFAAEITVPIWSCCEVAELWGNQWTYSSSHDPRSFHHTPLWTQQVWFDHWSIKSSDLERLFPECTSCLNLCFNLYACKSAQNWLHSSELNQQQLKQVSSMWTIPEGTRNMKDSASRFCILVLALIKAF